MSAPRSTSLNRLLVSLSIALAPMLAACDDTITAPSTPDPVATVEIIGSLAAIVSGAQRDFSVRLRDANGIQLTGRSVEWSSSDPTVATVTAAGRVTALSVGTAAIRARSEGRQGSVQIEVQAAPAVSIVLSETHLTLNRNSTRQLQATARDAYGRAVGAALDWASEDATVTTVSAAGEVTAIASGTTRILVRAGGLESSLTVTVPLSIAEVRVSPPAMVLNVGGSYAYSVQIFDDRGGRCRAIRLSGAAARPRSQPCPPPAWSRP